MPAKPIEDLTNLTGRAREDWRWRFLERLAETSCVSAACVSAGVSRFTAYRHRELFPVFRRKWDECLEIAVEWLELEARRRSLDPNDKESGAFLRFLLQAHRPEKYRGVTGKAPTQAEIDTPAAPPSIDPADPDIRAEAERELGQWRAKQKAEIEKLLSNSPSVKPTPPTS